MNRLPLLALFGVLPLASSAQTVYSENFADGNAASRWSFYSSVANDGQADNNGNEVNFAFDYSKVGIPAAPNSNGTTFGVKMESDVYGGTASASQMGMSISPKGLSVTGDYTLQFDAWQNFQGPFPGGGSGTTQALLGGIAGSEALQNPVGTLNGVAFGGTDDGGSTTDYRAFNRSTTQATVALNPGVYLAGSQDNGNAYYGGLQGTVPQTQTDYANGLTPTFTKQTGSTAKGALGMAWHTWTIAKVGSNVTWAVDGLAIATFSGVDFTATNPTRNDIFLSYYDTNTAASLDAASRQLLFGLVTDVKVTAAPVPEPATVAALGLGALALLRRRKRA